MEKLFVVLLDNPLIRPFVVILKMMVQRPGAFFLLFGSLVTLGCVIVLVIMSNFMSKCNSDVMPCPLDAPGSCRCAMRTADGSCWQTMEPAMKCFKSRMVIGWGICQGIYETSLCAETQADVDAAVSAIGTSYTELHPEGTSTCNLVLERENVRCQLPRASRSVRPLRLTECCKAPLQTCATDLDCCNCGQESQKCLKPLECVTSLLGANSTVGGRNSVRCGDEDDACVTYSFPGCSNTPQACFDVRPNLAISPRDEACCKDGSCAAKELGRCRSVCNSGGLLEGCPCVKVDGGDCLVRRCVTTANFFPQGGVEAYLRSQGATNIFVCKEDNCNQIA